MLYFFLNLIAHTAISAALVLLMIYRLRINQERRNRRGILYLLPFILMGIVLVQAIAFTIPRLLDTTDILRGVYITKIGSVEKIDFLNNAMTVDGERYFYNPFLHKPTVGDELNITCTRYSGYITDMEKTGE
ncbi:MAG: hypothetical protein GX099_08765 [Clostridiaceae bacterium]|nr:hypothetical protein [Clostridiaceae bacterium]